MPPSPEQIVAAAMELVGAELKFKIGAAEIRGNVYRVFENAPQNLVAFFREGAAHGDKDFIYYEDEVWSFAKVWDEATRLADALATEFNVKRGDRVAIAMRNYPEWCAAYMAIISLGAIVVPINSWWTGEELRYGFEDSGAKIAFVDGRRFELIAPHKASLSLKTILVRDENPASDYAYAEVISKGKASDLPDPGAKPEDDYAIYYTSGSTGNPKGVVLTHRGALTTLYSWRLITDAITKANNGVPLHGENPGIALGIPLFHVTGSHAIFLMSWLYGRRIAMMYRWNAREAIDLINRHTLTNFVGVPSQSYELIEAVGDTQVPSLIDIGSGGAKRPPEHVVKLKEKFPNANPSSGYGLTETNAAGCIISLEDYRNNPDAAGRPLPPCCDIKIVNDEQDCAQGVVGEVWIRTASNFREYLNKPEDTAKALTDDGWFRSGDLGKFDEQGFLYIVDRLKDLIIRGGENISCLEVEARAYEHDDVDQAIAFSVPDDALGERVGLVVHAKEGATINPEALRDFMAEALAKFKCPERIWVSPAPLPKLGTEKFDKQTIRRVALQHPPAWRA
ncbi:MAG: class I adenylate-forming enzyme family protein [Parvularculaceae bacterium]